MPPLRLRDRHSAHADHALPDRDGHCLYRGADVLCPDGTIAGRRPGTGTDSGLIYRIARMAQGMGPIFFGTLYEVPTPMPSSATAG